MNKMVMGSLSALLLTAGCASFSGGEKTLIGNWGLKLPYDAMSAGHLIVTAEGGVTNALLLWRWASPCKANSVTIDGAKFHIAHSWCFDLDGVVTGDTLTAVISRKNEKGERVEEGEVVGWRNPPIEPASTADARFGEAIDLLKDGLDGWKSMDEKAKFGWSFKDGVLSNKLGLKKDGTWAGGGANLMTKRADFYDFNLSYDVRVPKDSNSGVYLRGRYEIQTVDSYGKPVNEHNMAAYYGRVVPKVAAERKPGEWQHVNVTLYKRHLTVFLNGQAIIENAPVVGVTGGAIDAHEFVPGPIYLQGDHSDADYRNMILRKAY